MSVETNQDVTGIVVPVIRLYTDYTQKGNVGGDEDDLGTYTIKPLISANGKGVRVTAWGTFANNGNQKAVRLYFGATAHLMANTTSADVPWRFTLEVVRTGSATQASVCWGGVAATFSTQVVATPAETMSGDVIVKVTADGVDNDDIVQDAFVVELLK